jgi:hypothetical protein
MLDKEIKKLEPTHRSEKQSAREGLKKQNAFFLKKKGNTHSMNF